VACFKRLGQVPITGIFGGGSPDPKTRGLLKDLNPILDAGLGFPHLASLTPAFSRRYLERNGVFEAENPEQARTRARNGTFSARGKREIRDAVLALGEVLEGPLFVRSGEWASGLGIWDSKIAYLRPGTMLGKFNIREFLELVERCIKEVLISDFKPNAMVFKRMKKLTEPPGILLTPMEGTTAISDRGAKVFLPGISMNFLGWINRTCMYTLGCGIGAANDRYLVTGGMGNRIGWWGAEYEDRLIKSLHTAPYLGKDEGSTHYSEMKEFGKAQYRDYACKESAWKAVEKRIRGLIKITGPRYLELVSRGYQDPDLTVVQSAPFRYEKIKEPNMAEKQVVWSNIVYGTGIANTERVKYVDFYCRTNEALKEIEDYNRTHENYLLVLNLGFLTDICNLELRHVYNAKAIVVEFKETGRTYVHTHLNGWMREAGIIVVARYNPDEESKFQFGIMDSLKANPEQELKCMVYADEFKQKGWLAVL
jgi:hypothetical protein